MNLRIVITALGLVGLTVVSVASVPLTDVTLERPPSDGGLTTLGSVTGYGMTEAPLTNGWGAPTIQPLFQPFDARTSAWWSNLLNEALFARLHVFMFLNRGGPRPNFNNDPADLQSFIAAVDRANANGTVPPGVIRVCSFMDTAAVLDFTGNYIPLNLSVPANRDMVWTNFIKRFYDQFNGRRELWYNYAPPGMPGARPLVALWNGGDGYFSNQSSYAYTLFTELADKFQNAYGVRPVFFLDSTWKSKAPSLGNHPDVVGFTDWFTPETGSYTYVSSFNNAFPTWGTHSWGTVVPQFRDYFSPTRLQIPRNNGMTLANGLAQSYSLHADFAILEGLMNWEECAGYYRSSQWDFPNQYLGMVRDYADRRTQTLRYEAEGCDTFYPNVGGSGMPYRTDGLNTITLDPAGEWAVRSATPNAWVQYSQVQLSHGWYRFSARASADAMSMTTVTEGNLPWIDQDR